MKRRNESEILDEAEEDLVDGLRFYERIGGGFWLGVGGEIIVAGVDIVLGDRFNPVDNIIDFFFGKDEEE